MNKTFNLRINEYYNIITKMHKKRHPRPFLGTKLLLLRVAIYTYLTGNNWKNIYFKTRGKTILFVIMLSLPTVFTVNIL